jgi:hypothetical protein
MKNRGTLEGPRGGVGTEVATSDQGAQQPGSRNEHGVIDTRFLDREIDVSKIRFESRTPDIS